MHNIVIEYKSQSLRSVWSGNPEHDATRLGALYFINCQWRGLAYTDTTKILFSGPLREERSDALDDLIAWWLTNGEELLDSRVFEDVGTLEF